MVKSGKKYSWIFFLVIILIVAACRKEQKAITYTGKLLLSKKYPIPLSNRAIELYQRGSSGAIGLNAGSSASSSNSITSIDGNFSLLFKPGTAVFIVFSGASSAPLTLSSTDTIFPYFKKQNFPDSAYDPAKPIYIGKIIDTAIIKVNATVAINSSDTIGLQTLTIDGKVDKIYTGINALQGSTMVIDTIYNMLLTEYDGYQKGFRNTLNAGKKVTAAPGYSVIKSNFFISPPNLSVEDEKRVEILFYYIL
jgi:hypothetical protein